MEINLSIDNYRCFPAGKPVRIKLKKGFSAFVGVNNAGKSSLLKFFYELRPIFEPLGKDVNAPSGLWGGGTRGYAPVPEISDPDEMFFNGNRADIQIEITLEQVPNRVTEDVTKAIVILDRTRSVLSAKFFTSASAIDPTALSNLGPLLWSEERLRIPSAVVADFKHLRAAFKTLAETYYVPSFRHVSALTPVDGAVQNYYDIHVGRPFIDMWHGLQTGASKSGREKIHTLIAEIKNIFGFNELQISASMDRNTLQLIIDGKTFSLHEMGAGLAQFVVVLGNAAFRKPTFILIDEPELSLHPSLQLKFMMKLAGYASEGVIFATHNIGLARSVAEEIYSVTSASTGSEIAEIADTPRLAELLGELNYEGYRPLGFNKLLLVEGRTGVKTFIELLRLYNKDHEFLIVPMSDLINRYSHDELQEVTRICPHTFAVIDSERPNSGDPIEAGRNLFAQNCQGLGIDCLTLERRAIENYISDRAIKEVQGPTYRALAPYEGRQGILLWPKTENWKIARAMSRQELDATDLGGFLARI